MVQVGVYPKNKETKKAKTKTVRPYVATEHPKNVYKEGIDIDALSDWAVQYFRKWTTINVLSGMNP